MFDISFSDIKQAQSTLAPYIKETSVSFSDSFSEMLGLELFLKWESEHKIKSFKIRGALNKILSLTEKEKEAGLIASSAGNHAQGVALASQLAQVKARVVMMETASQVKISAARAFGAEVILKGKTYEESYLYATAN